MAHRIDTATSVADVNGSGRRGFVKGNSTTSTPSTRLSADWCNDLQENVCRVIEAAGIELVKGDYGQLTAAIQALIAASGANIYVSDDTGIANAYIAAAPAATTYMQMVMVLKISHGNTGNSTVNVAGLGAVVIKKMVAGALVDLAAGDLVAGGMAVLAYDGAVFQLVGSTAAASADIAVVAGWSHDGVGEDLRVQTYGSVKLARAVTIEGEVGDAGLAPTGAAVIMDIERDGVSIYTVKPQIAAGATALTAGVLDATKVACPAGTVLALKCTQVGSTIRGQQVRFTIKARTA